MNKINLSGFHFRISTAPVKHIILNLTILGEMRGRTGSKTPKSKPAKH